MMPRNPFGSPGMGMPPPTPAPGLPGISPPLPMPALAPKLLKGGTGKARSLKAKGGKAPHKGRGGGKKK